jgi:uncharacterized integral membrane protein
MFAFTAAAAAAAAAVVVLAAVVVVGVIVVVVVVPRIMSQAQKVVIRNTCSVMRKFLNDEDHVYTC